jgi:glycosyltransferase involved in cell wall biosynthesis
LKILLVNHPDSAGFLGGDSITLRRTGEELRALGVDVMETTDPAPDATGFDVAHVFNLRTYAATARQVATLARSGTPIVLTPFYMNIGFGHWASQVLYALLHSARTAAELQQLFETYRNHQLQITQPDGTVLTPGTGARPSPEHVTLARTVLSQVRCVLPNSSLEMDRIRKDLLAHETPFTVVPLGADAGTFLDADPGPFIRRYHLRDFVLQVGRIELMKNQLGLVRALRDLDLPVVLIGKALHEDYVQLCRRHGPRNLTVLPYLPADELPAAYAAARVHVLANWTETCGLVSLEAALADCNLVCSTAGYELEFFLDQAYYCEPTDLGTIRQAVERAFTQCESDAPRRRALRERIVRDYNWPRVAELTLDVYRRVAGERGHGL